jgi:adenylosuccinate lyase
MPSHPFDFEIQSNIFSTPELTAIFSEQRRFERWLAFEAALADSQAELGIIPREAAGEIRAKAGMDCLDLEGMREAYKKSRNSLMPLVQALRDACDDQHGEFVHYGATTQDVLDTSQVMELREVLRILFRDLRDLKKSLRDLTEEYRHTPMIGRSHGQQALPITFGLKCAVWLAEICRHSDRIIALAPRLLVGQLSGAVGSMAALGDQGREVARKTLERLDLNYSPVSWHTSRDTIAETANLMAMICSSLEKIANEVIELGKNEIGELREPAPAGAISSSTMPHKRNPVLSQRVAVLARQVRALAPTVTEAMVHEHERDGRAIWSEWLAIPQISIYTGTALNYIKQVVSGLEVVPEKMIDNLRLHGDMVLSEWLLFKLGSAVGKMKAQELMQVIATEARSGSRSLKECILADSSTAALLGQDDLEFLDHPENYLGLAETMIDELLRDLDTRHTDTPDGLR